MTIDLLALARERPVHFMGLGGAGMAPLADLVKRSGGQVTGCDANASATLDTLVASGLDASVGHDPSHIEGASALVVTSAVAADHPEIVAARAAEIPVLKRAAALGAVVNRGYVVGVAGTHGKTTTTALTTAVLHAAAMDPTGIVGGRVPAWNGNLLLGSESLYVVEADEFDRSFLALAPSIAVVTTLEADHLDVYGTLQGVEAAFLEFIDRTPAEGLVIACGDDAGVGRLLPRLGAPRRPVLTYGLSAGVMLRARKVEATGRSTQFEVVERGSVLGTATLHIPGLHNIRNALAAIGVARQLGAAWPAIAEGLVSYHGVDRRFEQIGDVDDVLVIDDYAHHPTEISATLQAARAAYPKRRIVAVFQPHLYSRTRDFAPDFGRALSTADVLFVTDVYAARELPIEGVSGRLIADPAATFGTDVRYLPARESVVEEVVAELRPGDVCITLGAGDLNAAARQVVSKLGGTREP